MALIRGRRLLRSGGWRALIDALPPKPTGQAPAAADIRAIGDECARAARLLPVATQCLERSYATCSILRRRGAPALFCVGLSRRPPMRFHAWVEVDEQVVNDGQWVRTSYQVLCTF
jgi:Transglutaminase-like superfamily